MGITREPKLKETVETLAMQMRGEDPRVVTPPFGQKWMCQVCEATFGQSLSVTNVITCWDCKVSLEREREFDTGRARR